MKKAILLILALVIIVGLGGIIFLASSANSLIQKYRPELERIAGDALGTKVSLGDLEVSLLPAAKIKVASLRLGSGTDGLGFKDFTAKVGLGKLLSGNVDIQEISLKSPSVTIEKDASGTRIVGLPKSDPAAPKAPPPSAAAPAGTTGGAPAELPSWLSLNLKSFSISDASLIFKDLVAQKTYAVTKISVESSVVVSNNTIELPQSKVSAIIVDKAPLSVVARGITFSVSEGLAVLKDLTLDLLGNKIGVNGTFNVKKFEGEIKVGSPQGINLASFAALSDVVPALNNPFIKGKLVPTVTTTILPQKIDTVGTVSVTEFAPSPIAVQFNTSIVGFQKALLNQLTVDGLGGKVLASGSTDFVSGALEGKATATTLNIAEALGIVSPAAAQMVSGSLQEFGITIGGNLNNLLPSLTGAGNLLVKDCTIAGYNLIGEVLRSVNKLPFLTGDLASQVPGDQRGAVDSNSTPLSSLSADFTLSDATVFTKNLNAVSSLFTFEGSGSATFAAALNLAATIYLTPQFSKSLAAKNKDVSKLFDSQERIVIPLLLQGTAPNLVVLPNIEKLLTTAGGKVLEEKATDFLNKALSGKGKKGGLFGF